MALETASLISQLNSSYPLGSDPVASADDHIRLIKSVLKATFPNINAPITVSPSDLNTRGVPSGFIGMWSGLATAIPTGWSLCDGTNGTPNLTDRFVVGAGAAYAVGATGGAVNAVTSSSGSHSHTTDPSGNHSHTGLAASHVLTVDEIPSHKHLSGWGESHGTGEFGVSTERGHQGSGETDYDNHLYYTSPVGGGQGHTHDVTINAAGAHSHMVSTSDGHTHTTDTRSPYFALCFIMKA